MLINLHHLLHLPVFTVSGVKFGKVFDIKFMIDTHTVYQYVIKPNYFSQKYFLIRPIQVKEITDRKMIVDDGVIKEVDEVTEKNTPITQPQVLNDVSFTQND
ncbi:MAG: hypothetical protein UR53_C0003G0024 [Candidatus Magasanikbacteria bacterium GW2011_GWC2_34_16]|uniref:PRC-barrel domain-containing protein n=2 Tax=Candidatus Magasanikiibacteriota TaxID=1752731 RepID=A0A0G0HRR5_9BACT|nr:MAG: hypothetical protein UR53_C0003G0024 [Candidatus Magasanikbacteria bacterium GW2011_GWC2_34_16]KKQ41300.1 MAG: hypothetical protein US58_C0002G0023 [Candidatus Magasanikbacteria bacterium GW2011_GWA2_37_8]